MSQEQAQKREQTTTTERSETASKVTPEERPEETEALIEETDDLLDEIDELLEETDLTAEDYHQEGGE